MTAGRAPARRGGDGENQISRISVRALFVLPLRSRSSRICCIVSMEPSDYSCSSPICFNTVSFHDAALVTDSVARRALVHDARAILVLHSLICSSCSKLFRWDKLSDHELRAAAQQRRVNATRAHAAASAERSERPRRHRSVDAASTIGAAASTSGGSASSSSATISERPVAAVSDAASAEDNATRYAADPAAHRAAASAALAAAATGASVHDVSVAARSAWYAARSATSSSDVTLHCWYLVAFGRTTPCDCALVPSTPAAIGYAGSMRPPHASHTQHLDEGGHVVFRLVGMTASGEWVETLPVHQVLTQQRIQTKWGRVYRLVGEMNQAKAQGCFHSGVAHRFRDGFPMDFRHLISRYLRRDFGLLECPPYDANAGEAEIFL